MTTVLPAGSGTLHYRVTIYKGQQFRRNSWVSVAAFKRCMQKDLSWYLARTGYAYVLILEYILTVSFVSFRKMLQWTRRILKLVRIVSILLFI